MDSECHGCGARFQQSRLRPYRVQRFGWRDYGQVEVVDGVFRCPQCERVGSLSDFVGRPALAGAR